MCINFVSVSCFWPEQGEIFAKFEFRKNEKCENRLSKKIYFFLQVHVTVFYESLCPDSIRFIKNQLEPNYQNFAQFIDIEFVPFGKSRVSLNFEKPKIFKTFNHR